MKWCIENMDILGYNYLTNYSQWFKRRGAMYLGALWMADSMGMMSNVNEGHNSLEVQFPIFAEAI